MLGVADALEANQKLIALENEADVVAAQQAGYESALIARLSLKPSKVRMSNVRVLPSYASFYF